MDYTDIEAVKNYLWIDSDVSCDLSISQLISQMGTEINSLLNIDGFWTWEVTETIDTRNVYISAHWFMIIYLKNFNVNEVSELNGIAYTWVKNTNYKIVNSRELRIKDYSSYSIDLSFGVIDVKYTYGWATIPDDIQRLTTLMVAKKYREQNPTYLKEEWGYNMQGVERYKLADEEITFSQWSALTKENDAMLSMKEEAEIKRILAKYKKLNVF